MTLVGENVREDFPGWLEGWKECESCSRPIYWYYKTDRERWEPVQSVCRVCDPEAWRK